MEFAIIATVMVAVTVGIIETGRGLYLRNELSYAADRAVRHVFYLAPSAGKEHSEIAADLRDAAATALSGFRPDPLVVQPVQQGDAWIVTLSYPFRLLIPCLPGLDCGWRDEFRVEVVRHVPAP